MKTYKFTVTIPGLPDTPQYTPELVEEWLAWQIGHPYDAAYEADVKVEYSSGVPPELANPEREDNGCMAHRKGTTPDDLPS